MLTTKQIEWTDTPRALSGAEKFVLRKVMQFARKDNRSARIEGIKLYREMTDATLRAANAFIRDFDA